MIGAIVIGGLLGGLGWPLFNKYFEIRRRGRFFYECPQCKFRVESDDPAGVEQLSRGHEHEEAI